MRRMFSLKQLQEIADSEVKKLVEGGTLNNAKPIYFHSIQLYKINPNNVFNFHILNNSADPIDDIAKLKAWAQQFEGLLDMPGNGCISVEGTFYPLLFLRKAGVNSYEFYYWSTNGFTSDTIILEDNFTNVVDNLNKVN